jgi:hypothetical protein
MKPIIRLKKAIRWLYLKSMTPMAKDKPVALHPIGRHRLPRRLMRAVTDRSTKNLGKAFGSRTIAHRLLGTKASITPMMIFVASA